MLSSLRDLLGLGGGDESAAAPDAVHAIMACLERLTPERARYVAAFAVVLSRIAHADLTIGGHERAKMEEVLAEIGHLDSKEAAAATDIAAEHSQRSGGTEHFLATRELAALATREQKEHLLECLFAVSAADGTISAPEENQIRQVASELGLGHHDFAEVRSRWNDQRSILR